MGSGASKEAEKEKNKVYLLDTLEDHDAGVNTLTLSNDGSLIVSCSEDNTARMWSTKMIPCECLGTLEGHTDYLTDCVISEAYAFTGSADGTIRKWDLATSACLYVYRGHVSRVTKLVSSAEFVFSCSTDKTARVWLAEMGEVDMEDSKACARTFEGHTKGIFSMVYVPADGVESDVIDKKLNINPSDRIITGSADCTARSWSFETGRCIKIFAGHKFPITCMGVSPDGRILYTGSGDATIRSWDIAKGESILEFSGHAGSIICLQVVSKILFTGSSDQSARSWVAEFGDSSRVFSQHKHSVTCLKCVDGILFTGCGDSMARAFDVKFGKLKRTFQGHEGVVTSLEIVGGKLFTGSVDGTIRVWDVSDLVSKAS